MKIFLSPDEASLFKDEKDTQPTLTLPIVEFAKNYLGLSRPRSGLLPPAVRWMSDDGTKIIVERPPFLHKVAKNWQDIQVAVEVPIPWTVYVIELSEGLRTLISFSAFFKKSQIFQEDDELFAVPGLDYENPNLVKSFFHPLHGPNAYKHLLKAYGAQTNRQPTIAHAILAAVASFWATYSVVFVKPETVPAPSFQLALQYPPPTAGHSLLTLEAYQKRIPHFLVENNVLYKDLCDKYVSSDNLSVDDHANLVSNIVSQWHSIPFEQITTQPWQVTPYTVGQFLDQFIVSGLAKQPQSIEEMFELVFGIVNPIEDTSPDG